MGFARYWMHNNWVTMGGEKMSKSLGNTLAVHELTKTVRPLVLRYYLGAVHYRSAIEYHESSLEEAAAAVARIESFVDRALPAGDGDFATAQFPAAFACAMDDDLGVSGALAVVFDTIREGNTALDERDDSTAESLARQVLAMTDVLGMNPRDEQWNSVAARGADAALGVLVEQLLQQRAQARAARDFASADRIRDGLTAAGVAVEDSPDGARWSVAGPPVAAIAGGNDKEVG